MPRKRRKARKRKRRRPHLRVPRSVLVSGGAVLLLAALWLLWPFWHLSGQFAEQPLIQPSRLYGRPVVLSRGAAFSAGKLVEMLRRQGYARAAEQGPLAPGQYRRVGEQLEVYQRPFLAANGPAGNVRLEVRFGRRSVLRLRLAGREVPAALLEPPLITSFYGPDLKERRPFGVDELPEELIHAVLAAEDARFFEHSGLSWKGILRAVWVNLRGGGLHQGGSTLTQQLVKNLYLTHERSLVRKLREALLAVLLELRYPKREILQAYLNEIYWGRSGPVNLMGVGAAARAYFGKDAPQLTLGETAVLAGMIRSPNRYSPVSHPGKAQERRDWVLRRMAQLGWLEEERLEVALATPVRTAPQPIDLNRARYAADAVAAEAKRRFGLGELADTGFTLLSTLVLDDQVAAEEAVSWGLQALERGWERGRRGGDPLQAALLSVDPRDGSVLAWVGGREYGQSQFDRVAQARRQAGSAFKPVVYATAFFDGVSSPAGMLEDAPLTLAMAGEPWSPQNDDGSFRGWVTARQALEQSINVPTVRLAERVGYKRIVDVARALGITSPLRPFPSLALGAFEVAPAELLTVYATFANDGSRPDVHALQAVFDRQGARVRGDNVQPPQPVLTPAVAFLVNSVLQGVLDRGTARSAREQGLQDPLAGKTGTTNRGRDSWFVGYAPSRATLVWVGYDDNSPTRLSGARAALPIWSRFTYAQRPAEGYPFFRQPPGIETAAIDPATGELAVDACPEVVTEAFLRGQAPTTVCILHGKGLRKRWDRQDRWEREKTRRWRRWLERILRPPRDA